MIKLSLVTEPYWLEISHGVRLKVRPLNTAIYESARAKSHTMVESLVRDAAEYRQVGARVEGLPDLTTEDGRAGVSQMLFAQSMACAAIIEWEGVADDTGAVIAVSDDAVCQLMRIHRMAEDFLIKYTAGYLAAVSEGNVSGSSPNGTMAADQNTGKGVEQKDSVAPAVA